MIDIFYNKENLNNYCVNSVKNNNIYVLSSFTYFISAIAIIIKYNKLKKLLPYFPLKLFILSVFINGITSYLSDVKFLNSNSIWNKIDKILSSCNTLLCIIIIIIVLNGKNIPVIPVIIFTIMIILGLIFKILSAKSINNCKNYILWHTLWHISIPLGTIIALYLL